MQEGMARKWSANRPCRFYLFFYLYLFFLSSISSHTIPRQDSLIQDQIPTINQQISRFSADGFPNSTSFEDYESNSESKRQAQAAQATIPNDNLDYSLEGMRDNGYFYTSKDFTSSIFNWNVNNPKWRNSIQGADLYLNTSIVHQEIDYGDAITDSSAYLLLRIKEANPKLYEQTMDYLFNVRTGRRIVRAPMGASDFSMAEYTYQDAQTFSISQASNITTILTEAKRRQPNLKIILTPWSPPAQWKTPETLNGGTFNFQNMDDYAQYFVNTAKAFDRLGLRPYAFTIQNEPFAQNLYPTMLLDASEQASLGSAIRSALNSNSFKDIKLLCLDHNFDLYEDAIQTFNQNPNTFDGAAFHAYNGSIDQMTEFQTATNSSAVYVTEMSFEIDRTSSQWTVMYYWLNSLFIPATQLYSRSVLLWNVILDSSFGPRLPAAFCNDCIGSMELSPEGTYSFYPQAHVISSFSAATASLSPFGGSVSRKVGVDFPREGHNQYSVWLGCLEQPLGFAATYDGGELSRYINGTAYEKEKRIGIVLANKCNNEFSIKIGVDDRSFNFQVQPGLSTLTLTLNSTQTSNAVKYPIGKLWLLSLFLFSTLLFFFQF